MKIECEIEYGEAEGDRGMVPCVTVTCSKCGHSAQAFGDSSASVRCALAKLREECPEGGGNWYVAESGEDED